MTLEQRLTQAIAEECGCAAAGITPDTSFRGDLALDSLELASLVVALEAEFEVELPDHAMENLLTVGDVLNYLTGVPA